MVANALKNAGYDLMTLVQEDILEKRDDIAGHYRIAREQDKNTVQKISDTV